MIEQKEADKKDRKFVWKHDWSGVCAPGGDEFSVKWRTFSVGIFQWVPAANGGLKKSAVKYRISGAAKHPETVYARAGEMCDFFDRGNRPLKKSEVVK